MDNDKNAKLRIKIVEKLKLGTEQLQHLEWRLSVPEHEFDCGPQSLWASEGYQSNLYAAIHLASDEPIGVAYRAGLPNEINAAWWIDSKYRGKGYASEMIELLAALLIVEGATGIGEIAINTFRGEYDMASRHLVARLKSKLL